MRALTLTQPWATLVAVGVKRIETRSWHTPYRGPLAIHAAKAMPPAARKFCEVADAHNALDAAGFRARDGSDLPRGAVLATCRLVDVHPIVGAGDLIRLSEPYVAWWSGAKPGSAGSSLHVWGEGEVEETITDQAPFGDFSPGRFAWVLEDVRAIEPMPASGRLGLWEWAA